MSWNTWIRLYLSSFRKRDRGLGLLNTLLVFDQSPNIAFMFIPQYNIKCMHQTNFFNKFRWISAVETITPWRRPKKMTSQYRWNPTRKCAYSICTRPLLIQYLKEYTCFWKNCTELQYHCLYDFVLIYFHPFFSCLISIV